MHVTWYHELRDSWVAWVRRLRAQLYVGYMRYVSPKRSLGLTFNVGNKEAVAQATLLKKRLCHSCFPVNFAKFRKTPFFTEHLWWLLLKDFCMGEFLLCMGPEILLQVIFFLRGSEYFGMCQILFRVQKNVFSRFGLLYYFVFGLLRLPLNSTRYISNLF